jgi:Tol biopolymer transport system component
MRKITSLLILVSLAACSPSAVKPTAYPTSSALKSWSSHGLSGRLVTIFFHEEGNQLLEIDLSSGQTRILYQPPKGGWLSGASVSPDEKQILLAYAPPRTDGKLQFGFTDLGVMPYDQPDALRPLLTRTDPQESYFNPTWAPDGQSIYYSHFYKADSNSNVPAYKYAVEETSLEGKSRALIQDAQWPVISPDGMQLSYISVDLVTFSNDLYLSNLDGSNKIPVLPGGNTPPVDDHLFTKDGKTIIFSMVNPQTSPTRSWLEKLLGIQVASAHNVPSDWYTAPIEGGQPQRMTNLEDTGLYGALSPDGEQIVFISASGLYEMDLDGSNLVQLSGDVFLGTIDWLP